MKTGLSGTKLVKEYEGLRLHAYTDSKGIWTIGYGHTGDVKPGDRITHHQADVLLSFDLEEAEEAVNRYVKVPLNQNQFDALVSFTYNLGPGALKRSTLLKVLNKGKYESAANQFYRWVFAGPKKLKGLVRRRAAERKLFLKPVQESKSV